MIFRIDPKLISSYKIYTKAIYIEGVDNTAVIDGIQALLNGVFSEINNDSSVCNADLYHNAMNACGINTKKYHCSAYALFNRVKKQGSIPFISPIVDLCNTISLKYGVPVGVHDADTLNDEMCVRLAGLSDCAIPQNSLDGDELKEGEPVYVSGDSVRTRRWFWRQMPAGRVTAEARNFIILVDGFEENSDIVDRASKELVSGINKFFNVEIKQSVIDKDNPEFVFGKLSEEDEIVENQLAIMLKGVAQHSVPSEIRAKIKRSIVNKEPLRIKLGLDPSAPDIHIGHSVVLRKIRQIQDLGHKAVIIIGDFTGMIGDPTGKSKTRKQLSREDVEHNANTYMEQIYKIICRYRNRTDPSTRCRQ